MEKPKQTQNMYGHKEIYLMFMYTKLAFRNGNELLIVLVIGKDSCSGVGTSHVP